MTDTVLYNRRDFIAKSVLATAALSAGASLAARPGESDAAVRKDGLYVPDGSLFAGMSGAYSAMYTPFFRNGEKAGELNEEMIERLVEYGVKKGLAGFYLTGSTGEGFLQSLDERKRVYARAAKGRMVALSSSRMSDASIRMMPVNSPATRRRLASTGRHPSRPSISGRTLTRPTTTTR